MKWESNYICWTGKKQKSRVWASWNHSMSHCCLKIKWHLITLYSTCMLNKFLSNFQFLRNDNCCFVAIALSRCIMSLLNMFLEFWSVILKTSYARSWIFHVFAWAMKSYKTAKNYFVTTKDVLSITVEVRTENWVIAYHWP